MKMTKLQRFASKIGSSIIALHLMASPVLALAPQPPIILDPATLGFAIPSAARVLSVVVRLFFIIAGLAALYIFLTGALGWVTSGGSKENIEKARDKIVAGFVGVILIVAILSVIWFLEVNVFNGKLCFGVTCEITLPTPLLQ